MSDKIIALTDRTYCINDKCKDKDICAIAECNYIFLENRLYSFCKFNEKNCEFKLDEGDK